MIGRPRAPRNLCAQCRLKPVRWNRNQFCSRACANSARPRVTLDERFLLYFHPAEPNACWPWTGTRDRNGYGVIGDERHRQIRAHRIAYERVHGPVPIGQNVLHRCDNPPCCNPAHLFVGTTADNNADRLSKGRYATGEAHPLAKLTAPQVLEIRALYPALSQQALADRYAINQTVVSDIVRRVKWKHV